VPRSALSTLPRALSSLGLALALSLSVSACRDKDDDAPLADPLDDPWVNAIEAEDEDEPAGAEVGAVAVADPNGAGEGAPALEPAPEPAEGGESGVGVDPEADPDPGAGGPGPTTAKGAGSGTKSPNGKSGSGDSGKAEPAPDSGDSGDPGALAEGTEPAAEPEPIPAVAPAAEPEPKPVVPAGPTLADFNGKYRFSGGSTQRGQLEDAIDEAAGQLAAVIRGIGRRRLTKTNPIDDNLEIKIVGDTVQTIFQTGFDAKCTIDGPTVSWTNAKGDKTYKVRVRRNKNKLVQIIRGEDGVKTSVFVLSKDGQKLTVHHKIDADRLDDPMTYRLSYKRK